MVTITRLAIVRVLIAFVLPKMFAEDNCSDLNFCFASNPFRPIGEPYE